MIAWHARGHDLARHPVALRPDLPLGRALQASRARRSRAFTEYDGNLGAVADRLAPDPAAVHRRARRIVGDRARALGGLPVPVHARPGAARGGDRATRGRVDDQRRWTKGRSSTRRTSSSFASSSTQGRCAAGRHVHPADHQRLTEIAEALFADLEAQGRTGHPLAWDNARAVDPGRPAHPARARRGLAPRPMDWCRRCSSGRSATRVIRRPGRRPRSPSIRTATCCVSAARSTASTCHRTDAPPRRALVIDYKTGGAWGFDGPRPGSRSGRQPPAARPVRARPARWSAWRDTLTRCAPNIASFPARADSSAFQIVVDSADRRAAGRGRASRCRRHSGRRLLTHTGRARAEHVQELPLLRVRPGLLDDARRGRRAQEAERVVCAAGATAVTLEPRRSGAGRPGGARATPE